MIELGHPMHAYDYDKITGKKLIARRAIEGEELHTLDDTSRKAKGEMLVIADSEKAAGLAGIMGGFETEITDTTTTVVLESADFYGPCIRRTARACGLSSEASGRFERGVDSETTIKALDRAAQLLQEMGACTVCEGIVDVYPNPKQANYVTSHQNKSIIISALISLKMLCLISLQVLVLMLQKMKMMKSLLKFHLGEMM